MAQPFLLPTRIATDLNEAQRDEERKFQGIPTLERAPEGRLWAAWYGGGITEDRSNFVLLATSGDDGEHWTTVGVIDPDGDGPVRAFDPCLWHDPEGRLCLFWAQGYEKHTDRLSGVWMIRTDQSEIERPQWSTPERISDGIMMNKPEVTSAGVWLLPVAEWHRDESAKVYASTDRGTSWGYLGGASVPDEKDRNCDEHMIVEHSDGSLLMLIRTSYGIGESRSTDGGATWSRVVPSRLAHTASRFFLRRLASGALLLVKHGPVDVTTSRRELNAYLSRDDGASWIGGLSIDEREGVSYPDGVEDPDGVIRVIYDYDRLGAKEILMAKFTESDVEAGTPSSSLFARRMLVNRATGVNPESR